MTIIEDRQKELTAYIDSVIEKYTPKAGYPDIIYEAVRYSLFGGGKRVRPMLAVMTSDMLGGDRSFIEPLFSAVEMIHTYSLIHDDLPAMDNDDYRRGRYTSHKQFGEAMAILAGDALLNMAYETMLGAAQGKDRRYLSACSLIAESAGIKGMVGGQAADIGNDETCRDGKVLEFIYANKTTALIRAAVLTGASSADISEDDFLALDEFSRHLGLIFQLTDDVQDMNGDEPEEGKATYGAVIGRQGCIDWVAELKDRALKLLDRFGSRADELRGYTEAIASRVH
ncbi:MAG: polyprenyl synthetase family protein [Eubacteriaceae bacterium]|nr:polyprenyl synthetase family protein [Eubacteriaceae bacterium]